VRGGIGRSRFPEHDAFASVFKGQELPVGRVADGVDRSFGRRRFPSMIFPVTASRTPTPSIPMPEGDTLCAVGLKKTNGDQFFSFDSQRSLRPHLPTAQDQIIMTGDDAFAIGRQGTIGSKYCALTCLSWVQSTCDFAVLRSHTRTRCVRCWPSDSATATRLSSSENAAPKGVRRVEAPVRAFPVRAPKFELIAVRLGEEAREDVLPRGDNKFVRRASDGAGASRAVRPSAHQTGAR